MVVAEIRAGLLVVAPILEGTAFLEVAVVMIVSAVVLDISFLKSSKNNCWPMSVSI